MLTSGLMIDIAGTELTDEDREILRHPKVGGIILFTRNYDSREQLKKLTTEINKLRTPKLMIAVDHEGGRVQRFRNEFTLLPAMRELGKLYDQNPDQALRETENIGFVMASELAACGVDCSFAPVLDIDTGISKLLDGRCFHHDPAVISKLAIALVKGMHRGKLLAVGKHFPGHGHVAADSHFAIPVDDRDLETILKSDILPFQQLINDGIDGIMPAHVIYSKVDDKPAGFSSFWLKSQLREKLNFNGIIFSDDLSMEGASPMGNYPERTQRAFEAGCDMVLICNTRHAVIEVLEHEYS